MNQNIKCTPFWGTHCILCRHKRMDLWQGAQQQTRWPPLLLSIDRTNWLTDGLEDTGPLHRACCAYYAGSGILSKGIDGWSCFWHGGLFREGKIVSTCPILCMKINEIQIPTQGSLGSRVVSVPHSDAEGPGFKSQSQRCRATVLGKLLTPIAPLFMKQRN